MRLLLLFVDFCRLVWYYFNDNDSLRAERIRLEMRNGFDEIVAKVKECGRKTVAVSVAQDEAVLEAVREAKRLGIADAILVGDAAQIKEIAKSIDMDLAGYEIIDEPDMIQNFLRDLCASHAE